MTRRWLLVVALGACGSDKSPADPDEVIPCTFALTPRDVSMNLGASMKITSRRTGNSSPCDRVVWGVSGDANTISSSAFTDTTIVIDAIGVGTAMLHAHSIFQSKSDSVQITVVP